MSEQVESYIIPGKKFGSYAFCPIHDFEPEEGERIEFLLLPEMERLLAPTEARNTIARIHANNIIQYARSVIKTEKFYVHAGYRFNYVFYSMKHPLTEAQAYKKVIEIESSPEKFASNDVFTEKQQNP